MTIHERIRSAYDEPPAVLVAPCDGNPWIVTRPVTERAGLALASDNDGGVTVQLGLECGPVVDYLELLESNGLAPAVGGGGSGGGTGQEEHDHGGSVA